MSLVRPATPGAPLPEDVVCLPCPPPPCERVGPDPVLGVRSSHFSHKTPLSPGRGPSPQPRSPGRGGALSWLGWLRSNGLFFTACQFLNCVAISFFMEKKKKKRNRKWFRLIYLHKCRRRILSKLLHKYWNCLFFHGAGGRRGFLLTCLFSDHAAAKLSEVEWRGTGGRGPGARDRGISKLAFFRSLSCSLPVLPPLHGRALHLSPHSLQAFLYLSEPQNTDLSEQSASCRGPLLSGLSVE